MEPRVMVLPVKITDDRVIWVQATLISSGEQDVASNLLSFEGITEAVEAISGKITAVIEKVRPQKASVEFGIGLAAKAGHLTALLVNGSGNANLNIKLEWGAQGQNAAPR